jgi:small subunit ribosomal protein S6
MRKYETLMVLHPELPDAQTRETIERARRLVTDMGGEINQLQEWGIRELAYPIRRFTRGYYVLLEYRSTAAVVNELERTLKIADEVLRFLSVEASSVRPGSDAGKARSNKSEAAIRPSAGSINGEEQADDTPPTTEEHEHAR